MKIIVDIPEIYRDNYKDVYNGSMKAAEILNAIINNGTEVKQSELDKEYIHILNNATNSDGIKKCCRCRKPAYIVTEKDKYSEDFAVHLEIYKDMIPFEGTQKLPLCLDCRHKLDKWLEGERL